MDVCGAACGRATWFGVDVNRSVFAVDESPVAAGTGGTADASILVVSVANSFPKASVGALVVGAVDSGGCIRDGAGRRSGVADVSDGFSASG